MRKVPLIIWLRESTGGHCRRTAQESCVIRSSMQTSEGEVQMGTTRADGRRHLDEEAWELCYDVATLAIWCLVIWTKIESWP